MPAAGHLLEEFAIRVAPLQLTLEYFAKKLTAVCQLDDSRFDRATDQEPIEILLVLDVRLGTSTLRPEQWGLCDVDVTAVDQLMHLTIKERQQQRSDMRSVDVGVRHDDDAVIAQ